MILAIACGSNEDSPTADIERDRDSTEIFNDQGINVARSFIAWEGRSLTGKHRKELARKGLNPSDYQLHSVGPDGDCEQRVAIFNLLFEVLVDQNPPFEEFARRVKNCTATYAAADPRFSQHAQIKEALEAIQQLQGKSLKEILVRMNDVKIDRLLIEHFSRPMLAAGAFLAGREVLNNLLTLTGLTETFKGEDIRSEATLTKIANRVNFFVENLEKRDRKKFVEKLSASPIAPQGEAYKKAENFHVTKVLIADYLTVCKTTIDASRRFYQSKNYGFDLIGGTVAYKDKYHIMAYKNINDELVTPSIPSGVPILVPTGTSSHVNVLIRKDAFQEEIGTSTQVAPIN